jgi:phosphate transport system permease protein
VYRSVKEKWIERALFFSASLSVLTTVGIIAILVVECFHFFQHVPIWNFLTDNAWTPLFENKQFGIFTLVSGTFITSIIAMIVALPLGLTIAIYLGEYASPQRRAIIKPILEILAAVPTIVYGYFALLFVTPLLQLVIPGLSGFNALSPGLVMGIMILPLVCSLSEDAMSAVPKSLRDAAYALGSSKLQVATKVVIPAAFSGISAAFILAISRALGETMLVAIAAGQMANMTLNPLQPVQTMTAFIVQVSLGDTPTGTLEYQTIFAVGMMLFLMTFGLNQVSLYLNSKLREKYS